MTDAPCDLFIIGGGVNGAAIARDAAGRGLKVILAEAGDLAGATSSASTKLIHGGLRYLEYYDFKLVREALQERKVLLSIAPHIIWPLVFVLPHDRHLRPAWLIRMGLFLYDHLASHGRLPGSHGIKFAGSPYGAPLKDHFSQGFTYSDCWVEDARLVALNALDAQEHGAEILTRTTCRSLRSDGQNWQIMLHNAKGTERSINARMVVNAAGPWVRHILDENKLTKTDTPSVRLVKGSHIVTRKLFEGEQAYILQQPDKRIIFAIPYEKDFTLIGTTDEDFHDDAHDVKISQKEIDYLCGAVNLSFKKQIGPADIVWSYSGVRPLFDDGKSGASAVTRDYRLVTEDFNGLPILSVFGGKITTNRHLAEEAVDHLLHHSKTQGHKFAAGKPWTGKTPLPGGDIPDGDFAAFAAAQSRHYPWLPPQLTERYARAYGTRMDRIIGTARNLDDLGQHYGGGLYEAEACYLIAHEFARTAQDILWRRSKLGLHLLPEAVTALEQALPDLLDSTLKNPS